MVLSLKVPVACSCSVPPLGTLGFDGEMVIEARVAVVTVRFAVALLPPYCPVTVLLPAADAVASPEVLMVATLKAEELHAVDVVMFCVLPSESDAMAENCCVVPLAMLGAGGVTLRLDTVALVTTTDAEDVSPW